MKRKKILKNLMVVAACATVATAFAGCSDDGQNNIRVYDAVYFQDIYMVVEENGQHTLHKGDAGRRSDSGTNEVSGDVPILYLDCGEELYTSQFVGYKTEPSVDKYDTKCELCF